MSSARALGEILELARAVSCRTERCPSCGGRVHRTREDVLLHEALARYDEIVAREWREEAPTKPDRA